jgi:hypothetical protein
MMTSQHRKATFSIEGPGPVHITGRLVDVKQMVMEQQVMMMQRMGEMEEE